MGREEVDDSGGQSLDMDFGLDELLSLEKGLKAQRWRERAEAARLAARTLAKDGYVRQLSSNRGPSPRPNRVLDIYNKLLRQLLHVLAIKDSIWQVRVASVESAATILAATQGVLPADTFSEYVWVVLASCLDTQPEVQSAASSCILQQLLPSSFHKRHVIAAQLCDRFVNAAVAADALHLESSKLSRKSEVTGLDNLPDGEVLLTGLTAAICLQLLPSPTSDGVKSSGKYVPDRIPLLVVVVAVALEDANRRQSRMIARGLSKLLRCLGLPMYRQSLAIMFNPRAPVYLYGDGLAGFYQNAGIINEDTYTALTTVKTVTILKGLSLAFEASHADASYEAGLANAIIGDNSSTLPQSKVSGLSQKELIALQQILEMLQVPESLTRTLKDQDKESKTFEFTESAMPLLSISTCIIKDKSWVHEDEPVAKKLVEDLILCCATFAGGDGEYEGAATWTSNRLRDISMTLLTYVSDNVYSSGPQDVSRNGALTNSPSTRMLRLIVGQIPSLLPRIKQVIEDSSGSSGGEVLHNFAPDGSVSSSIIAAYQMRWILRQLEHPNLGPHCHLVMPCVLTALDHFSPEVKREAMGTCIHLAQNMNPTELRWYKDVVLDAVARSIVGCGDLWPVAVKMAVTTVTFIEGKNPRSSWCGKIFSEMLGELERQRNDQGRRVIWLHEISPQMEAMGLVLVAHFKRLLPLLFHWLHAPDDVTCLLTLNKLQVVITCTWPRIPVHVRRIWKELMHTYQESSKRKSSSDIQAAVFRVCKLLHLCAGPTFEAVWQQDKEDKSIDGLVSFLTQVKIEDPLQK